MQKDTIRKTVRSRYGQIAKRETSCCCSGGFGPTTAETISRHIGYSNQEMKSVPQGANLGLGCGNPIALASLKKGETVLDLGSGAGFDCFLASPRVGPSGKVIGVDMTPEMLEKARANARKGKYQNVDFRLGEIENLPVADQEVDVIISNCVINLSPDKEHVFREAFRVLKPGGRLMVSDIVLTKPLPDAIKKSIAAYVGCVAGASQKEQYLAGIKAAGFEKVTVAEESTFDTDCVATDPKAKAMMSAANLSPAFLKGLSKSVLSARISAIKPRAKA